MYQGALFQKAQAYAKALYGRYFILSAKYGVLSPWEVVSPYDQSLNQFSKGERERWRQMVSDQIKSMELQGPLIFLASRLYCDGFEGEKPLEGMGLGRQLQWLNAELAKLSAVRGKNKGFGLGPG